VSVVSRYCKLYVSFHWVGIRVRVSYYTTRLETFQHWGGLLWLCLRKRRFCKHKINTEYTTAATVIFQTSDLLIMHVRCIVKSTGTSTWKRYSLKWSKIDFNQLNLLPILCFPQLRNHFISSTFNIRQFIEGHLGKMSLSGSLLLFDGLHYIWVTYVTANNRLLTFELLIFIGSKSSRYEKKYIQTK